MNQKDKIGRDYQPGSPCSALSCVAVRNFCSYLNHDTLGFHSLGSELDTSGTSNYGNPVLDLK